ncbi:A24 family peptidase [Micromonospora sp. S-DT3-3-22]|uniref:prepilin peptidase n=1 Tax=Micromonospora sp. S-DT3-3-22 TaxID=2755359 RepID=UPI0018900542|nr:A24 family peptidase [Micromonospora sp. S-DT3-3-22]
MTGTSVGLVTAAATLGVLAGLAAPRIARAFPPPATPRPSPPGNAVPPPAREPDARSAGHGTPPVVVGAVVCGGLAAARGAEPALPAFLLVAAVGVVLAVVDLASLRLPDPLVGAAALGGGTALTVAAVAAGTPGRLALALVGAALSFLLYVVLALLPRSRLGFGDVKLAAVLGLPLGWLGWPALWLGLLLPHLLNGVLVLALLAAGRVRRDTALPFGPALLTGAWLAALLA